VAVETWAWSSSGFGWLPWGFVWTRRCRRMGRASNVERQGSRGESGFTEGRKIDGFFMEGRDYRDDTNVLE